jgi:hypothetical protein
MNLSFYVGSTIILFIVFLDGYIKNKKQIWKNQNWFLILQKIISWEKY